VTLGYLLWAGKMPDTPKSIEKKPLCFVIGPIGKDGSPERKHSDLLLNAVIKHVLQQDEFGYLVKRADDDADPGMIGDRMISDIIHSELVVADLTDLNPNAFYELGIRHATEEPTIHIAKMGTVLPFDNVTHRTIFVDLTDWHSTEEARKRLADSVRAIKAPDYKVSNPITQANASFKMRQSDDPRDRVLADMQERMVSIESRFAGTAANARTEDLALAETVGRRIGAELRAGQDSEAVQTCIHHFDFNRVQAVKFIELLRQNKFEQAARKLAIIFPGSTSKTVANLVVDGIVATMNPPPR
jgi:hypothetical protein